MKDRDERELRRGLRAMVTEPPPGPPMTGVIEAARARRRRDRAGLGVVAVLVAGSLVLPGMLTRDRGAQRPLTPPPVPSAVASVAPMPRGSGPVVVGQQYHFDLYVHCGIRYTTFGGRPWRAAPEDTERYASYDVGRVYTLRGTMTLVSTDEARFRSDTGDVTATFRPVGRIEPCD
ncbi:hypothetical protein Acy02nite_80100 [Actinoplanes cyaneus]|uniref:Uncharacterized protein n=1 Tax=Actinoplanes cyaneus TaxID=52696 RepID=A0A919MBZ0_9ACTN|nr:hypothetical protein [Actinoplanes cyaneus]MCW2140783.1 hypothetical protein [Actinoplanes cyaneus]GID70129.1 hypothetical protein Acy02nite_80100 [Actinoplanes cyaneus]